MNAAAPTSCGLTVLRTVRDYLATKQWRFADGQWGKVSYEAGAYFKPTEHVVDDLDGLVEVLDKVRRDPRAFVVRGELAPWAREQIAAEPGGVIRRRKHKKDNIEPPLVETDRRWIMIDVDNWPLPTWADLVDDPAGAIDTAVYALLPEAFHDAECWWQLSASAGCFSPGMLKAHLFFWLSEPANNLHIKAVLKQHAPGVDTSPFNAAQPHYVADPIINGGPDPIPQRTGWRKGLEKAVVLPELIAVARPATVEGATPPRVKGTVIQRAIATLGHGEGRDGFHGPITKAIMGYALQSARRGDRNDGGFKDWIRDRIRSAPCRPGGDVERPYCEEYYLQSSIDGAFALVAGSEEIQTMRPHHKPAVETVGEARDAVARHIKGFFNRAQAWHSLLPADQAEQPAEHAAIAVSTGVGKSTKARAELAEYIGKAKAAGRPHRILWLVPHHRLGAETLKDMEGLGLRVAGLYGRDADVPSTGCADDDERPQKVCLNLDAVDDALSIGADVERSVCGSGRDGEPACPYRSECFYQQQKKVVASADVVVAAHNSLFHRLPKIIRKDLGLVVADEAWWQIGLRPNGASRLATFAEEPTTQPVLKRRAKGDTRRPAPDMEATNDLHVYALRAQKAFAAVADGELVNRQAVVDAGLSAEDCTEAAKLEWQRKVEGVIFPGMAPAARKQAIVEALGNAAIPRRAGTWHALADLLNGTETHTGRLQIGIKPETEGPASRVVLLHSRADIREEITDLPILYLDATMRADVVRHYLPRLSVLATVVAAAPHMRCHQITGGWGKTTLVQSDKAAPAENRGRARTVAELRDFVRANSGGNALVVTYKAIEQQFTEPGIQTGHFNAMSGLDVYRDVRSLFIIGRPLPDAYELRTMGLALTGRPIAPETGQKEAFGALMADGTGVGINVRAYANPDLEALRVAITESEVMQAIGRGRGVNRDAASPLDVFILADVALPLPLTRLAAWNSVCPDVLMRMAARGVLLTGPTDAQRAYPDLFPTAEAARKALKRAEDGGDLADISLRYSFLGDCPVNHLIRVDYRPAGRGQQDRVAYARISRLPELRTWLETVCGAPLARYDVAPVPEPPRPPAPGPAARQPQPEREPANAFEALRQADPAIAAKFDTTQQMGAQLFRLQAQRASLEKRQCARHWSHGVRPAGM